MNTVMFGTQIWKTRNDGTFSGLPLSYRTKVFFTQQPIWTHIWDDTSCEHGVDVPNDEWAEVDWPLHCKSQFLVMAGNSSPPFWIDDIVVSDSGFGPIEAGE
jgi:hypothetical protein